MPGVAAICKPQRASSASAAGIHGSAAIGGQIAVSLTGTPMHGNQQAAKAVTAQEASVSDAVALEIS